MGTGRSGLSKGLKNKTVKNIGQVLGRQLKPLFERYSLDEAMRIINPLYNAPGTGTDYTHNCALCTTAAALQLLGYDVEAMPRDKTWRGFDSVFDYKWTPENFKRPNSDINWAGVPWYENYHNTNKFTSNRKDKVMSEITEQMKSWGNNSFAAMNVKWTGGGAHVVIVHNNGGQVNMMDFQTHEKHTVSGWFNAHPSAKPGSIGLYRLDNQIIKKNIPDLDKIVRRRRKK